MTRLTETMLEHARAGEWEQVIQMESDRQVLIQQFFKNNRPETFANEIADGITRVMNTDREIMQLGKNELQILSKHLRDINTGKQAQNAYLVLS